MLGATRRPQEYLFVVLLLFLVAGCTASEGISAQIAHQFDSRDTVDLSTVGPDDWDRVCVLGPYSGNETAQNVLGFDWDAEAKASIALNDGINVLVFTSGKSVVAYSEHPRNKGDFASVASTCSSRQEAKLARKPGSWALVWTRS
jgi:hypothetical protein